MSGKRFISLSRSLGSSVVENSVPNLINMLTNMTNNKQTAIICVRDPFESSMSTVASELDKLTDNIFKFNDYLVRNVADGSVDWSDEAFVTVYSKLNKAVQKHLRSNFGDKNMTHTVVIAPFIQLSDMKPYRVMMQQYEANKFVVYECLPSLSSNLEERANYLRNDVKINEIIPKVTQWLTQQKQILKEDDMDLTPSQNVLLKHLTTQQNNLRNTISQTRFTNNVLEDIQLCAYLMHHSSECKTMDIFWNQLCKFEYITSDSALWR